MTDAAVVIVDFANDPVRFPSIGEIALRSVSRMRRKVAAEASASLRRCLLLLLCRFAALLCRFVATLRAPTFDPMS
jgi:hypothetical protein